MKTHSCSCGVCQLHQADEHAAARQRIDGYAVDLSRATGAQYGVSAVINEYGEVLTARLSVTRDNLTAFGTDTARGVSLRRAEDILADALRVATEAATLERTRR